MYVYVAFSVSSLKYRNIILDDLWNISSFVTFKCHLYSHSRRQHRKDNYLHLKPFRGNNNIMNLIIHMIYIYIQLSSNKYYYYYYYYMFYFNVYFKIYYYSFIYLFVLLYQIDAYKCLSFSLSQYKFILLLLLCNGHLRDLIIYTF